ncbi:glycosyltransferase family 4 protein [Cyclobacterium sp. SYSU L10401]|uniref:glycosyltransferase family 4 protein n=1 Tax=Cyclobacterium sp. SYSU L10401 TaxID=2678657 RepID=UPI0013D18C9A|nr:glycosyltransferase family 4 protein [Cyclobacterium sp. SYSU L10401]
MAAIFLYPKIDKMIGSPNPYILNFQDALSKNHRVVNARSPNRGILNFFLFFFSADTFILNWPETLPEKKFGNIQQGLFRVFLWLKKTFKKKIIWVLHNKGSHHKGENSTTRQMFDMLMVHSDFIITHSHAGDEFVGEVYPEHRHKVHVIPHPIKGLLGKGRYHPENKKYDFLIWGSVFRYKGIDRFLQFCHSSSALKKAKILIVGKCKDLDYKQEILSILPENAEFRDELLSLEEIAVFADQSRFTLFTYNSKTVISSGSLIDAIRMGAVVVGPDHGAFKDLKKYDFMRTFGDFEDIPRMMEGFNEDGKKIERDRLLFMKENTWENFVNKLEQITGI